MTSNLVPVMPWVTRNRLNREQGFLTSWSSHTFDLLMSAVDLSTVYFELISCSRKLNLVSRVN